eukprot:2521552-Rhodomonas_salina.2
MAELNSTSGSTIRACQYWHTPEIRWDQNWNTSGCTPVSVLAAACGYGDVSTNSSATMRVWANGKQT